MPIIIGENQLNSSCTLFYFALIELCHFIATYLIFGIVLNCAISMLSAIIISNSITSFSIKFKLKITNYG